MTWGVGAIMALLGASAYAGGFALWILSQRRHAEVWAMLDEARRCNHEFSEAILLLEYGARDEAVEALNRWQERHVLGGRSEAQAPKAPAASGGHRHDGGRRHA